MIIITSIQAATASVERLAALATARGISITLVGDRKSPADAIWPRPIEFVSMAVQSTLPFRLASLLPANHYARKNLGYLLAFSRKAPFVYETDDDNAPNDHWEVRREECEARSCTQPGWLNAYSAFTRDRIWPRGLPLEHIATSTPSPSAVGQLQARLAPVQQGLADGSPDVDAVWRLVQDKDFSFERCASLALARGTWCPFNSQSTWWYPTAYRLMYLPSFVSFRMTDIWRSFVAQRCLWELGHELVFHAAEVHQDRNQHNLLKDFEQECVGYLQNDKIKNALDALTLQQGEAHVAENMRTCYRALQDMRIVNAQELTLLDAWLADCDSLL